MIPIKSNVLNGLEWRQPSAFNRNYELKSGDSVLAELAFLKTFGTLARMSTAAGAWTYKRAGFLSPVVTARQEGSEEDLATYQPNWMARKGALTLSTGEGLTFGAANFWASEWVLATAQGAELLRFHNKGILHHGAAVEVSEAGKTRVDAAMLLGLCWYIMVLHMQDSAAVTASV